MQTAFSACRTFSAQETGLLRSLICKAAESQKKDLRCGESLLMPNAAKPIWPECQAAFWLHRLKKYFRRLQPRLPAGPAPVHKSAARCKTVRPNSRCGTNRGQLRQSQPDCRN